MYINRQYGLDTLPVLLTGRVVQRWRPEESEHEKKHPLSSIAYTCCLCVNQTRCNIVYLQEVILLQV